MPETKRLVAKTAIDQLFSQKHFSICKLNDVLDLLGASRNTDAHTALKALHCVDYADMPADLRSRLPFLVKEALANPQNHPATTIVFSN